MTRDISGHIRAGYVFDPTGERIPTPGARNNGAALPVIRVTHELHEVVNAAVASLDRDSSLYQRTARLVRIVRVAERDASAARMAVGTPQIRQVALPTLRECLTRSARYERHDARSQEWRQTTPHDRIVSAVLERGEYPHVRSLVGVIETPTMRPDGSLLDRPGYDAATGYLYLPGRSYPPIADRPTRVDAERALGALREPWADFPARSGADRDVPVAAVMTLVARPAIAGACPAFVLDASVRGSGKTLVTRAISTLAHGREASLMRWPTDPAEAEKVLGAYAIRGASVINFDNVASTFGSASLDSVLTCADAVDLRVLGKTEVPSLPWRAVVLASGNNIVIGGDTTRRVLVCRLEPMVERPEERTGYAIADLPTWCRDHHPHHVAAALTLLRAYVVAGRPPQGLAGWGSYERWSELIASAIVWAGGADVMTCRPTIAGEDDDDLSALRTVIEHLPRLAGTAGITTQRLIAALYPPERMRGTAPPDGYDDLREAFEALAPPPRAGMAPDARKLGGAFRRLRKRVAGGHYLAKLPRDDRTGAALWMIQETRG